MVTTTITSDCAAICDSIEFDIIVNIRTGRVSIPAGYTIIVTPRSLKQNINDRTNEASNASFSNGKDMKKFFLNQPAPLKAAASIYDAGSFRYEVIIIL